MSFCSSWHLTIKDLITFWEFNALPLGVLLGPAPEGIQGRIATDNNKTLAVKTHAVAGYLFSTAAKTSSANELPFL